MVPAPRHIRVFLSSPGDVPEERQIAAKVLNDLEIDPLLVGRITIQVVAWDQRGSTTPMLATMTPQEAINEGMPLPKDCDLVIVIFWSRMGTPLPPEYTKPNGEGFQSGTEWEYLNALEAAQQSAKRGEHPSRPQVVIYRRTEDIALSPRDPKLADKLAQWQRVEDLFATFVNPDGSIRQGYNPYTSPDDFRQQLEQHMKKLVGELLEASTIGSEPAAQAAPVRALWQGSPFPGLRAFTPDDEPIFYGRGEETDALVERLRTSRFVAVLGASGSGKSSLVGAGLLPRLTNNAIEGSKDWILPTRGGDRDNRSWVGLRFTPGENNDPFVPLAMRLAERLKRQPRDLAAEMAARPEALSALLEPLFVGRPDWSEILIFIDQFEELFTLADKNKIEPFVALLHAVQNSARLRVVVTLRADFYARCVSYEGLAELLQAGSFPLSTPGTADLYEMIARPADQAALTFDPGVIDRILSDTGGNPGSLALLAFLLDEFYRTRSADNRLTLKAYEALGGVKGAIGKRAEEIVSHLSAEEQAALPRLFSEIVGVDERGRGTRRRAPLERLNADPSLKRVIDVLIEARLLVTDTSEEREAVIEVAHEALLGEWERLSNWIVSAQADLLLRHQLEQAARDWERAAPSDKESFGLVGGRLHEALRWKAANHAESFVDDFITACVQYAEKREAAEIKRQRALNQARFGIALAVGLILVLGIVFLLAQNQNAAERATEALAAQSTALSAKATIERGADISQSQVLSSGVQDALAINHPDIAVALALEANRVAQPPLEAQRALADATANSWIEYVYHGHSGDVLQVVYSPDGKTAASASDDYTIRLWDVATGQTIHTFGEVNNADPNIGHTDSIQTLTFSPDGKTILSGSIDHSMILWDVVNGTIIRRFPYSDSIVTVAISPDGKTALSGSVDDKMVWWDLETGERIIYCKDPEKKECQNEYTGNTGNIESVAFSPNGQTALSASVDGWLILWDLATGRIIRLFDNTRPLLSVAFSPDGRLAASGAQFSNSGGTYWDVNLWDVETGKRLQSLSVHTGAVLSVAFSPDGKSLVSASADRSMILWDVASGILLRRYYGHTATINSAVFSPDGNHILSASQDSTLIRWDATSGPRLGTFIGHKQSVFSVAIGLDGTMALSGSGDTTVMLWDMVSHQPIRTFGQNKNTDSTLGHVGTVYGVAFSPNGKSAISGSSDTTLILWNLETGDHKTFGQPNNTDTKLGHISVVTTVAFSPDGKSVLSGSWDRTLRLWDVATGKLIRTFTGHTNWIYNVAFSPDGTQALSASQDRTVILWDVATGDFLRSFKGHNDWVMSVAFSPDGQTMLSGSRDLTLILWDLETGNIIRRFHGHTDWVYGVAFSPEGTMAASGSRDKSVILWGIATGSVIQRFAGHVNWVYDVTFSPDGKSVLSGSTDRTLALWNISYYPNPFISWVQNHRYAPELTCEQRQIYALPLCAEGKFTTRTPSATELASATVTASPTPSETPNASITPSMTPFTETPTYIFDRPPAFNLTLTAVSTVKQSSEMTLTAIGIVASDYRATQTATAASISLTPIP